jgi:predicted HicB family RNase H-like nuclease
MPIAKRPQGARIPQQDEQAAEAFIDGAKKAVAPKRKRKVRVMVQYDEDVLAKIDAAASKRGMSRSAWIQYRTSEGLEKEFPE